MYCLYYNWSLATNYSPIYKHQIENRLNDALSQQKKVDSADGMLRAWVKLKY